MNADDCPSTCPVRQRLQHDLDRLRAKHANFAAVTNELITELVAENLGLRTNQKETE